MKKSENTPTGASTNPKDLNLNKNLNLIKIENTEFANCESENQAWK